MESGGASGLLGPAELGTPAPGCPVMHEARTVWLSTSCWGPHGFPSPGGRWALGFSCGYLRGQRWGLSCRPSPGHLSWLWRHRTHLQAPHSCGLAECSRMSAEPVQGARSVPGGKGVAVGGRRVGSPDTPSPCPSGRSSVPRLCCLAPPDVWACGEVPERALETGPALPVPALTHV